MPASDVEAVPPTYDLANSRIALEYNPWMKNKYDSPRASAYSDHATVVRDKPESRQDTRPLCNSVAQNTITATPQYDRHWNYEKSRKSLRYREPRSCGMIWRILLSLSLMAAIICSALSPKAMASNTALCVTVGIGSFVAAAQFYIIVTRFVRCLPYSIWVVVVLDGLSVLGWIAAIAVLAYWHRDVLYRPRKGDASEWLSCYNSAGSHNVWDSTIGGTSSTVDLVWCSVRVDGRWRLIGNSAARLQHRTVLGLSSASLFFNSFVLYISVRKQRDPDWCKV